MRWQPAIRTAPQYCDDPVYIAHKGVKRLAVMTPGFSADCLETLEEIGGENAEYFLEAGGQQFSAVPRLNDTDHGMRVIESLVRRELMGWLPLPGHQDADIAALQNNATEPA